MGWLLLLKNQLAVVLKQLASLEDRMIGGGYILRATFFMGGRNTNLI